MLEWYISARYRRKVKILFRWLILANCQKTVRHIVLPCIVGSATPPVFSVYHSYDYRPNWSLLGLSAADRQQSRLPFFVAYALESSKRIGRKMREFYDYRLHFLKKYTYWSFFSAWKFRGLADVTFSLPTQYFSNYCIRCLVHN